MCGLDGTQSLVDKMHRQFEALTERRRKHLLETPFPDAWVAILQANVAAYALLLPDEQQRLRDLTQIFIAEKNFEGCGGLELTDEIRVTIAGTGCQMLLGRDHELFRRVISILVYPSTFVLPPRPLGVFYQQPRDALRDTPVVGGCGNTVPRLTAELVGPIGAVEDVVVVSPPVTLANSATKPQSKRSAAMPATTHATSLMYTARFWGWMTTTASSLDMRCR